MKKVFDILEKIILYILGALVCVMVLVIFMQVVLRYGFKSATNWADEVARYCMIWVVFLASPVGYRRHSHIRIDVLVRYLPEKIQKVLEFAMYLLQIVFLGVTLYAALEYLPSVAGQTSLSSLKINMMYMHMATVTGVTLMILFICERIWDEFIRPALEAKKTKEAKI